MSTQLVEPKVSSAGTNGDSAITAPDQIRLRRRTVDLLLIAVGSVFAIVLATAGGLLMWGSNFANDHVGDELTAQNIFFPDQASLEAEGRDDLVSYAGEQVTNGDQAQAYASYIDHHLEDVAGGATYADLGGPERAAKDELQAAIDSGADEATVTELQATVDEIGGQRNTLFKGETLRGLLLSTYAWSTIGRIAGIAAVVAFVAAAVMFVLVMLGVVHRWRTRGAPTS